LWLSGMAASQAAEYQEGITQWQKVLPFIEILLKVTIKI